MSLELESASESDRLDLLGLCFQVIGLMELIGLLDLGTTRGSGGAQTGLRLAQKRDAEKTPRFEFAQKRGLSIAGMYIRSRQTGGKRRNRQL